MHPHPQDEASPLLRQGSTPSSVQDAPHPRTTPFALRVAAAMYSFAVLGLFTSSIGALLPSISHHYFLSDLHVSTIFLVGPLGYVVASQSNALFHARFGQLGVAVVGPMLHILAAAAISLRPSFPIVLAAFGVAAAGCALLDGSWCAWAGAMERGNTVSGLLHGSFSAGAAIGPFLVAVIVTKGPERWYEWYYVLGAASVLELVVLVLAFRHETTSRHAETQEHHMRTYWETLHDILKHRATWLSAAYFLSYVGTENAISGWVVSFMVRARHATPYQASLASTVFWAAMAVGRFILGPLTDRLGVATVTTAYLCSGLAVEVLFAIVRAPSASIILMMLLGFIMGPLFPSGIVLLTRHLPKPLHVQAVSLIAAIGQVGAAIFPFGIGALIEEAGISAFEYAIVTFLVLTLLLWIAFSSLRTRTTGPLLEEHAEVQISG